MILGDYGKDEMVWIVKFCIFFRVINKIGRM